jgi:ADP-ribose diphosphatase
MNEAPPEVQNSTIAFEGRIFKIEVDTLRFPDGRVVKMEAVRHRGSVVRYVVDRWLWELPAGSIDQGETADAAALRECHEEIDKIAGRAQRLGTYFPSPGFCDEAMNFFLLTDLRDRRAGEAAAHQDPDELLTVKEFALADVRTMIRAGEIVDMKTIVGMTLIS